MRHFWLFTIFGVLFFAFFYLYFGAERFQVLTFYAWLWVASLAVLLGLLRYKPKLDRGGEAVPDFDEDITPTGIVEIAGTVALCFGFSMLWAQLLRRSLLEVAGVIYVPLSMDVANMVQGMVMQLSWQLFVVGWSEEILCYILAVLGGSIVNAGKTGREVFAVVFSRGIWSILHTIKNPAYLSQPLMVIPAFTSGVLFYLLLKASKSLPAAATAHGLVNFLIYTATPS
jgi:membrane protease YdiL (CAAX protease family)